MANSSSAYFYTLIYPFSLGVFSEISDYFSFIYSYSVCYISVIVLPLSPSEILVLSNEISFVEIEKQPILLFFTSELLGVVVLWITVDAVLTLSTFFCEYLCLIF